MSIIRAPRPEANFYMLNKAISEDARLSWAARGLLVYLLGKPDHWEVSTQHLINQTAQCLGKASGRDAVRGIIRELEQAGYLQIALARADSGEFGGRCYTVSEVPAPENPGPAEPSPVNPPLVSIEGKQVLKTAASTDTSNGDQVGFDQFWKLYPRKIGKSAAEKAWAKLAVGQDLFGVIARALAAQAVSHAWLKDGGQFIPHASTWLNGKRWEDEVPAQARSHASFNNLPQHTPDMYQEASDGRANF